ncbi:MAG: hypothetical protein OEY35_02010, partial [Gammaproteobacteria bacterium]|nr:hypothetical protein [Gammaproteobacteria bacterium]
MSKDSRNTPLVDEHQALSVYLEALLEEVPESLPEAEERPVVTAKEVLTPPVIAPPPVLPVVEEKTEVVT